MGALRKILAFCCVVAVNQWYQSAFTGAPSGVTSARSLESRAGSSLFRASSLSDWLRPEAAAFPGLHLPRRPSWPNYQVEIDQVQGDFRAEGDFGALETTVSKVEGGSGWDFEQAADDLLGRAKLPQDSG
eukprot:g24502.t1